MSSLEQITTTSNLIQARKLVGATYLTDKVVLADGLEINLTDKIKDHFQNKSPKEIQKALLVIHLKFLK